MKIAITGQEGKIGSEIMLQRKVHPLLMDITDPDQVKWEIDRIKPDVIIHCASIFSKDFIAGK